MRALGAQGLLITVGLFCFGCTGGGGTAATSAVPGCPPDASRAVTQFYDWYIRAGEGYRERLFEQRRLFQPALYADLQSAFLLAPPAEAFLDVDPFNGAQVSSYGFRLDGCRIHSSDQLEVRLLVKAGLSPERTSEQPISVWLSLADGEWRIQDIQYMPLLVRESYRLRPLLEQLLTIDAQDSEHSGGDVMLTPGFRVVVQRHCPEGTLMCDQVSYLGTDRQAGSSISLVGSTVYRFCADGITPCQFIGYIFQNGSTTYEVSDSGTLRVIQAGKILLEQQGEWQR
jgi:hypothetical protein